jgi:hypothetical protein
VLIYGCPAHESTKQSPLHDAMVSVVLHGGMRLQTYSLAAHVWLELVEEENKSFVYFEGKIVGPGKGICR